MGLRSRLEIEYKGMFFSALFYLVASVANLIILGVYDLRLLHITFLAVLSLIAAFGLYRLQRWSLWLVVSLFFIATTNIAFMLNISIANYTANADLSNLLAIIAWTVYLILTWIVTVYVAAKRKNLK
ncbi:MAG: hypothetical protein NWE91_06995 [Candidatus Bathyarchaeota archaeon]|nr:hypothetical protein [Candidatus Bathyarchaeota archaeon]